MNFYASTFLPILIKILHYYLNIVLQKGDRRVSFILNRLQKNVIFTTKCGVALYCSLVQRRIISFYADVTKKIEHPNI